MKRRMKKETKREDPLQTNRNFLLECINHRPIRKVQSGIFYPPGALFSLDKRVGGCKTQKKYQQTSRRIEVEKVPLILNGREGVYFIGFDNGLSLNNKIIPDSPNNVLVCHDGMDSARKSKNTRWTKLRARRNLFNRSEDAFSVDTASTSSSTA
ncbi:unnamed protein product [Bursaphelenchus xylophilus]|uniref:(pine wood nematode) hypothetical protein n=1 Tax=Bursaphelenchus xylophilus TaxID=6326 RepID=A0A1I7SI07_BURXY|nr:unnamed protein product [Bursaphelenchus xylophilus]CAG9122106.1 unnamed protein product [Bursaphelenchus xylophilus]